MGGRWLIRMLEIFQHQRLFFMTIMTGLLTLQLVRQGQAEGQAMSRASLMAWRSGAC